MLKLITWIIRAVFLLLLYFFIFKVVLWMMKDLRKTSGGEAGRRSPSLPAEDLRPRKALAGLVVLESPDYSLPRGVVLPIGNQVTIGRGGQNRIRLQDHFTSQEHAEISWADGQFWIKDLQSRNGTFVNGCRIDHVVPLAKGDQIKIGGVTFQFVRWEYEVQ